MKSTPKANQDTCKVEDGVSNSGNPKIEKVSQREEKCVSEKFLLDPVVASKMRPHQIDGAHFILKRINGQWPLVGDDDSEILECSTSDPGLKSGGVILADEMGTGKTLTSLSVLWALVRNGMGKGLIICPSSLVDNWVNEIRKWLPQSASRGALFVQSGGKNPDVTIGRFLNFHSSVHPILVLSYEMFRSFSNALNCVDSLDVIVCDEGHRLKNADGTQTLNALSMCRACKRIVLTGTPVQNNLKELYTLVNFVQPGYLGDLDEFSSEFIQPIENGFQITGDGDTVRDRMIRSAQCHAILNLRSKLTFVLLRRTKEMVLKAILPARHDVIVRCKMSQELFSQYESQVRECLEDGAGDGGLLDTASLASEAGEEENLDTGKSENRSRKSLLILPLIMRLRQMCNSNSGGFTHPSGKSVDNVKMKILLMMLKSLYGTREERLYKKMEDLEKIVIVSNFNATLNNVAAMCSRHGWPSLRIDGSVHSSKRQQLVNQFNGKSTPFLVMLLSSKAGGVGLNLTGACRLVLLDPDWNPATDLQAMSRIWRDGQVRPCYIYRFVCTNTVEEAIMNRQEVKDALSFVVPERDSKMNASRIDEQELSKLFREGVCERGISSDPASILSLCLPTSTSKKSGKSFGDAFFSFENNPTMMDPVLEQMIAFSDGRKNS
jgi:DNA repair and recombination RAD54-like protein